MISPPYIEDNPFNDLQWRIQGVSLRPKIISISCSFSENLAKSYVGAHPTRIGAPSYRESWIRL